MNVFIGWSTVLFMSFYENFCFCDLKFCFLLGNWCKSNYSNWAVLLFRCSERHVCIKYSAEKTDSVVEMFICFLGKDEFDEQRINNAAHNRLV